MFRALMTLRLAPFVFIAAVAALSALGLAGAWTVARNATPIGVLLWMLPSIVVGSLFTVYGTALLQSAFIGTRHPSDREELWRKSRMLILVFLIFSLTIGLAAFLYVRDLTVTVRQERLADQGSIAATKAQLLERELIRRSIEAQVLSASLRQLPLDRDSLSADDLRLAEVLLAEWMAARGDRTGVSLTAIDGRQLVHVGEAGGAVASAGPERARSRLVERRTPAGMRLDFIEPIHDGRQPVTGLVVVSVDPALGLWPESLHWISEDDTSAILVVRREDEHAVILYSSIPEQPAGRRQLEVPLSDPEAVAVQAVLRGNGVREGIDRRGVPVISASRKVGGTDWHVIAQTDSAEALGPLRYRANVVIALTAASILVAALATAGLFYVDRASYAVLAARHERERRALVGHYGQMMANARDFIFLLDDERRILDANEAAVAGYGYSLEELRRMEAIDLRPERLQDAMAGDWAKMQASGIPFETVHRRKDGVELPVEINAGTFRTEGRTYIQEFVRDITYRTRLETEVARLAKVQTALQTAAGVLLRAASRDELCQAMCRILVDVGGYRLASVALANDDATRSVRFVAAAGQDVDYLQASEVRWDGSARSHGPTGAAILTGEVQINQDVASNPAMELWREESLKRGLLASIGLPLRAGGRVIGALTIHAGQAFAFGREEVAFLVQFAADLSYGIDKLVKGPKVQ